MDSTTYDPTQQTENIVGPSLIEQFAGTPSDNPELNWQGQYYYQARRFIHNDPTLEPSELPRRRRYLEFNLPRSSH